MKVLSVNGKIPLVDGKAISAISGSPIVDDSLENTVQYRQMNATAASFIENVDYTENANDYSTTKVTPYYSATTAYSKEEPSGLQIKVPANTALTIEQGGKTRSEAVSGIGTIYNMEPLKAGTFAFGGKTYKIVPEGGVRMIYTPSVWNVRDLGGWTCTGGRVKYGKIFRDGHFGNITDADKSTLVDWLGIKTDIDLRNNGEIGGITASPLGSSVEYFHQSLDFYANAVSTSAASARTVAVLKKGDVLRSHKQALLFPLYEWCRQNGNNCLPSAFAAGCISERQG